jgi:ParB/RepB/Spo0J family partition protein
MKEAVKTTEVELSEIIQMTDNVRKGQDPDFNNLVENVKANGILQPVILRAHPKIKNRYQLLAGHRRYRAAEKVGLKAIPAAIYDVNDQEALIITVTENLQRQNLSPLEEGAEVNRLMSAHNGDARAIAGELGKTPQWVARRASLAKLIPEWHKEFANPKSRYRNWSAGHMEMISRFNPEIQRDIYEHLKKQFQYRTSEIDLTVRELEEQLADLTHFLKRAPWKLDDDSLVPAAGACTTCAKRSCHQALLFEDDLTEEKIKANDKCLDRDCWRKKQEAHVARRIADLQQKHSNLVKVSSEYGIDIPDDVLHRRDYDDVKKGTKGSVPAVVSNGRGAGTLKWITIGSWAKKNSATKPRDKDGKVKPASLAEKKKKFQHRRNAWIIAEIRKLLEKPTINLPMQILNSEAPHRGMIALAISFGTDKRKNYFSSGDTKLWMDCQNIIKADDGDVAAYQLLWKQIAPVLCERLNFHNGEAATERIPEGKMICELLCQEFKELDKKSIEALPDPKSWAKEEKQKTKKATKKAAKTKKAPEDKSSKPKAAKKKTTKKKRQVKRGSLLNRA